MPRLDGMQDLKMGRGGFGFTAARIDQLEATEYTLVTIALDATGSISGFESQIDQMLKDAIGACKKSPRFDNILVRVAYFGTQFSRGVEEIIGFTPVADIDLGKIPPIRAGGSTPLCDAVYSALGATNVYAEQLRQNDFSVNAIMFVVSDGGENASVTTMQMVKDEQKLVMQSEQLESSISILIGINTAGCGPELARFQQEAGMTQYIDAGNATSGQLAKLAQFVSRSISSQSQALGTGGPSQQIAATI